ncbi:MAG: RNase H-like domain-containing protein, partial [Gloeomargaritales cyanobacterium]
MQRFEYVGHDLTARGNCPAASKFDLINDWCLPTTGQSLHSFVGQIAFYAKFCPWFEFKVKPLRAMIVSFRRKPIPATAWTPDTIHLFEQMKQEITSSPCLARYDSTLPCFLKTDWSAVGMGYALLQPGNDEASIAALIRLENGDASDFENTLTGARLRPVCFGSRRCS